MTISAARSFIIIIVVAAVTFATRALPFFLFPKKKKIPPLIQYLGDILPPAVIGMLVVYCLKSVDFFLAPHGAPELAAVGIVVLLHIWKRNNLLSIGVGTVCYMFLIQNVFA